MIFDTHTHYTDSAFDPDREALLAALPQNGVARVVDCGTDLASARASLALAGRFPFLYTAAGIHPESLIQPDASTRLQFGGDWRAELQALAPLYQNPRVVAVGECGLDYHWPVPKQAQLELFEAQLQLAAELRLPVIIHDREAHADLYALLRRYRPRGVVHCYSGSAQDLEWLTAQGLYIGFGGVVTFKNARRALQAAAAVPASRLLLETDCPYLAPEPCRGHRNDSTLLRHVAPVLAALRGVSTEALLAQTMENGCALFGLPLPDGAFCPDSAPPADPLPPGGPPPR